MAERRRAPQEFEQTQNEAGPRVLTLDSLVGGYNGYTSPDLLTPQFWAASSQVYAGQFGTIRRARWAPFFNNTASGFTAHAQRIVSMFSFLDPTLLGFPPNQFTVNRVLFDNNDDVTWPRWVSNNPLSASGMVAAVLTQPLDEVWDRFIGQQPSADFPFALSILNGPWMRTRIGNAIYETNGQFRCKTVPNTIVESSPLFMFWGLDAPDVSPGITLVAGSTATIVAATGAVRANNIVTITTTAALSAGMVTGVYVQIAGVTDTTFDTAAGVAVQITVTGGSSFTFPQVGAASTSGSGTVTLGITKTIGRSYQWAWEADINSETSAPSPASQFVKYTNQTGTIDLVETGTVSVVSGNTGVTGVGTSFSPAWVGRALWVEGAPGLGNYIVSVASATSMTLKNGYSAGTIGGARFQVYDPQILNAFPPGEGFVKLYATGDGQPVYFLIGRNAFNPNGTTALLAGLEFNDTANSEPPNPPFTSEITQIYNVPPPIGKFCQDYQGRVLVYGVVANLQTFFYSNIEATVIGQPPECFSPLNTVTMPLGDGQLNGMSNLPTGLIIWSSRQDMYKLTGLLSDNTIANPAQLAATIQRLPYKIGCASPYATAVTPLGAIWLSSDREVWLFTDHYAPKNVGKPVQDVLNRINGARLGFAKMQFYKRGDRSWLALALALDSSTFNNKLLLLDLDLLASNGAPSYFTFDMATNAPTWYQFDINCESIITSYDNNSTNHLFVGDVDLITDVDWQPSYFTIGAEQSIPTPGVTLHAFGNEDPHMIKTFEWMRALTNQIPNNLASQGWAWAVNAFDDDKFVIGVNALTTNLIPGVDSNSNPLFLEYSPAKFKFGGFRPVKGRRFQIGTTFPTAPGLYELRGFEVAYTGIVGR
jgi:hypothetical protein